MTRQNTTARVRILAVNGGGTGQTPEDMARAGRVAHNGTGPKQ